MVDDNKNDIQDVDNTIKNGESAYSEGRLEDAENLFKLVLSQHPAHVDALNNLAVVCQHNGDFERAELLFLRAAALSDDPGAIYTNLSAVALSTGQVPEATGYLERALALDGETPRILEQMSAITDAMGDGATATMLWKKARSIAGESQTHWKAAFTEIDITPNIQAKAIELQGYFGGTRTPTAVETDLKLQVCMLEDGYRQRVLFVSADIFGFGPELVSGLRAEAALWGIQSESLILNASHTHYAPGTVSHAIPGLGAMDVDFARAVCAAVSNALPMLYQDLQPAKVSWTRCEGQIGFNRRRETEGRIEMHPNPGGHYERETPILLIERDDHQRCVMVNHGCHPTGLGPQAVICADYPGILRNSLYDRKEADVVLFLQGAAGNLKQGARVGEKCGWIARHEDVAVLGSELADAVASALKRTTPIQGPIKAVSQSVVLPLKGTPIDSHVFEHPDNAHVPRPILDAWMGAALNRYPSGARGFEIQVGAVSLGPAVFVTLPGEPMAETANRIRALTDRHDVTFCLGYTNGLAAYFPCDEMIEQGGYEAHMSAYIYSLPSPFASGVETQLLDGVYRCMRAVAPSIELPAEAPRMPAAHEAFFVLSTGRSGTQTLAEVFKLAENAKVWHHPQPYMIKETQQAYWDVIDRRSTFWAGRGQLIRETWDKGLIHGETDHNMTPFCDLIAEDVPGARFIISVRDPREFVRSGMRRNYYRGQGAWEDGRLRPQSNDPISADWEKRDQFDQVCWLWAETYRHIERIREKIGNDRVLVVKFEDLVSGPELTEKVFNFLGLDGFDAEKIAQILGQKLNAQHVGDFPHPSEWPRELHQRCWAEVGEVAKLYGYEENYIRHH